MRLFGRNSYSSVPCTDIQPTTEIEREHLLPQSTTTLHEEVAAEESMAAASTVTTPVVPTEPPPPKPDVNAPPPYEEVDSNHLHPSDDAAEVQPPTYEEVQRLKAIEAGEEPPRPSPQVVDASGMHVMRFPSLGGMESQTAEMVEEQILGTDLMFFVAFTATFIFNWVGFVLLLCFCHTVAGRTGALAGFGLSLAKWTVIVRHSMEMTDANKTWLLWLIMVLGLLVFVRGVLQYVHAKREFMKLPHNARPQFVLVH